MFPDFPSKDGMEGEWEVYDTVSSELAMGEFLHGLIRMLRPELVVETGCFGGHTTRMLGLACQANRKGRVVSCDILEECIERTKIRCERLPVEVRLQSSLDLPELREADFIFSDSGTHDIRKKEYEMAKQGAVYVVHDAIQAFDPEHLDAWILEHGGLLFRAGRGFGVLIHP